MPRFSVRFLLLLLGTPFAAHTAGAQMMPPDTGRTVVTTSGVARSTFVPDRATLTLFVEPQAMSVEEAGNRLASVERAVLDTLRRFNLPASAIQTFNGGVAPYRSNMSSSASPSFSGRSSIRVELTRIDQVAAVSGAALAKGASLVSSPIFTLSTSDSLRRSLVPQAFQQARREAETLAAAAGGHLGRLVDITEGTNPFEFSQQAQAGYISTMVYDSGQRSVPSSSLVVSVTTRWLLLPGRQ